ncbi:Auxin Efflux Carrier [Spirochaeta thermophila DSM 6578]|uniref:Auxin Efflux Carrier n=1 Tax=Winmispira thermophila (strain ATCC 700085 / DSM 6578 / Z-1203) TaxID=869211 RepID=G0GB41_WINT7|nr:transporter [Spirochaeta thermophila]AEJ61065.1 Auxin Efflux Carrier [Spirochaeta thermophila DSM 6578]
MLQIVDKLLPVLLLIASGHLLRRIRVLEPPGLSTLKNLVIDLGLPAVMFLSFLRIELDPRLTLVVVLIFALNLLLFFLRKMEPIGGKGTFAPFLMSGFEYGMFAFGVFSVAYGEEHIPLIAVTDLGHELFIWFIFVPALIGTAGGRRGLGRTILSFMTSPVIIGIVLGLTANLLGLRIPLEGAPISAGIIRMLEMIASMTGPLILLVVGAGLEFSPHGFHLAFRTLAVRFPTVLLLFFALSRFVFKGWLDLPSGYSTALFVLLLSPPPYVIPIFMGERHDEEQGRINTTLALYTLVSLGAFLVYFARFPMIGT